MMVDHSRPFSGHLGDLRPIDIYFADCMTKLAESDNKELWLGAALASNKTGEGHSCVPLTEFAERPLFADEQWEGLTAPSLEQWRNALLQSSVVASPGDQAPLVLDDFDQLYLQRYWAFEFNVATKIKLRLQHPCVTNTDKLKAGLNRLFPVREDETDWQRVAAAVSVLKPISVISGGPGTGKTTTITKILALLIEQSHPQISRIDLSAPTGKAAARLSEAVKKAKQDLSIEKTIAECIPDQAQTLHRLLKAIPGRAGFRHNVDYPLITDVLVVDEASMVDLPLMSRLLDALRTGTRLILLGDMDQLASVEPGNVFGDICNAGTAISCSQTLQSQLSPLIGTMPEETECEISSSIGDSITVLDKSYRFSEKSGIGYLAKAVNQGDIERCWSLFKDQQFSDIKWNSVNDEQRPTKLARCVVESYRVFLQQDDPEIALDTFNRFRVLCALRQGPTGVIQVNQAIEKALQTAGLINPYERWYQGRPVMITRNDYPLRLFNGDIGIVLPDQENGGRMRAFFHTVEGPLRKFPVDRLPDHETAFAMTIHKSQGSEFDQVLCVLPDELASVLSKELIYTAITRAKQSIEIWGIQPVFAAAISRVNRRFSGLREKLWGVVE